MESEEIKVGKYIFWIGLIIILSIVIWISFIYPLLRPWWASQSGKAELAQADQNRQIKIVEAEAANIAATSNAEARIKIAIADATSEVERAKGVAQANKIISDSLKGNQEYLHYLWINSLEHTTNRVVYIPTEANLPILEAGKFMEKEK